MTTALERRRLAALCWWLAALLLAAASSNWSVAQEARDGGSGTDIETETEAAVEYGKVGYLHINGTIDRVRYRYLKRALESATTSNVDTLVVHIDTDGGEVNYARQMMKLILDQPRAGRRTIAFVDFRAISAGALIAYGHQSLYISDTATIGDIGVILVKPGGEIEYAPEKIETVVRALLAQAAEQNGWSRGPLLKMTARNQKLYRVTLADGRIEYVIEDDLPEFLSRYPDIAQHNREQVIVYRGKDRLLTLTGKEAIKLGMATALAPDLDSLYRHLGVDAAEVQDFRANTAEQVASYLAGWAPLLAGLALLLIVFELKTPGVGLWALLGAICGVLFLIAQYTLDMVDNVEVILLFLGLALLAIEFFTMAGGGLLALAGVIIVAIGLLLAFLPNELPFDFSDQRFLDALRTAASSSLIGIGILAVGTIALIAMVPGSRLGKRLAVQSEISATSAGQRQPAADNLLGRRGVARDVLHPGGIVVIDDQQHNARAAFGVYINAGQAVEVIGIEFGELIVKASVASENSP